MLEPGLESIRVSEIISQVVGGSGGIVQELPREKYWVGNPICPTQEVFTEGNSN